MVCVEGPFKFLIWRKKKKFPVNLHICGEECHFYIFIIEVTSYTTQGSHDLQWTSMTLYKYLMYVQFR